MPKTNKCNKQTNKQMQPTCNELAMATTKLTKKQTAWCGMSCQRNGLQSENTYGQARYLQHCSILCCQHCEAVLMMIIVLAESFFYNVIASPKILKLCLLESLWSQRFEFIAGGEQNFWESIESILETQMLCNNPPPLQDFDSLAKPIRCSMSLLQWGPPIYNAGDSSHW